LTRPGTPGAVAAAGAPGAVEPVDVAGAVPKWAPGGGGAPWAPGTGRELALGNPCPCGSAFGATLAGVARGVPGLAVGLIDALGGIGNLPCWIRDARCATAGGSEGPGVPARAAAAAVGELGVAGGWLITVLITVVLWMLAKTMLFGGGAT
jgi:hypothetical protein